MQKLSRILLITALSTFCWLGSSNPANAERERVLQQIDLPHHYYYREMYLPQLTSGPSSLAWAPDSTRVVFSMLGNLWLWLRDTTHDGVNYLDDAARAAIHQEWLEDKGDRLYDPFLADGAPPVPKE